MGRGDRPRLSPGWNVLFACALTVAVMTALDAGPSQADAPMTPGPIAHLVP